MILAKKMPVYTVVVCDSQPVAMEGLRSLLQGADGYRVVAAGTSLTEGMEAARGLRPSLWVMDKSFGVRRILECLEVSRSFEARPAVVVWGDPLSPAESLRFLQAGASGVVRKTAALKDLLSCFQTVAGGNFWMEDDLRRGPNRPAWACHVPLTHREAEIMERLERGWRNRDIAADLGIRIGTVKIHVKHIFEKTGIRGRYGIAISSLRERGSPPEARAV
ncbi:MAG: response regulator transcription factor [Bryobacteraceae bacterium]